LCADPSSHKKPSIPASPQHSALFVHDVKGWSADALINEGRRTMNLALRFEYRQRYLAEIVYCRSGAATTTRSPIVTRWPLQSASNFKCTKMVHILPESL
jgi:hypothetical protein